jgi:hypothetical protein
MFIKKLEKKKGFQPGTIYSAREFTPSQKGRHGGLVCTVQFHLSRVSAALFAIGIKSSPGFGAECRFYMHNFSRIAH